MNILKQSTAATIKLGPFIDDGDGKSAETGLTISQADIRLSKNGGDFAQTNNAAGATHDEFGYYDIPLDTTDTNTLGRLRVAVSESGALPVWQDFLVVTANVYDTLCSTDTFDVNVATIATDAITAAALKADAVTEIQNGLALEATLTAIKGAGWTGETLETLSDQLDDIPTVAEFEARTKAADDYFDPATDFVALGDDAITANQVEETAVTKIQNGLALEATLTAIKGTGWTNETLAKIVTDIAAISAGSGATAQEVWEYATRVLTAGTNIDLSALATAANLATLDGKVDTVDGIVDAIKAKSDLIPASPAEAGEYTAAIAAVKSVADDILVDTGTTLPATLATIAGYTDGIAGDVWSHATRTLTVPAVAAAATEDGTTLTLYKDADINIEFTGLTIPTGAKKVVFTIKDNLDDADTAAALQATYQLTDVPAETHTLNYINSAVPPVLTTPVTFTVDTDSVEFDMTAAAAYYLPRYERGYLKWDLKLITATTVQILQQGLVQILGTSTRTVA